MEKQIAPATPSTLPPFFYKCSLCDELRPFERPCACLKGARISYDELLDEFHITLLSPNGWSHVLTLYQPDIDEGESLGNHLTLAVRDFAEADKS